MTSLTTRIIRRRRQMQGEAVPTRVVEPADTADDRAIASEGLAAAGAPRGATVDTAVTPAVQIASAWSWRLLVIAGAVAVLAWVLRYLSEVVIPVVVAALLTALLVPVTKALQRLHLPRGAAAGMTVLATLAVLGGLLTVVGTQISSSFDELSSQVGQGIQQLRDVVRVNFGITDAQVDEAIAKIKDTFTSGGDLAGKASAVGTTATHLVAGLFIALFATFFFLYQGDRIWAWLVRLLPRRARERADSSGRRAWVSLTAFVRATVLVAAVDAIGITIGAWALGLPLVAAIGILVFVGAFVPVVGALVSGSVAVLVGLVAQGPWVAVAMLLVVLAVQQLESHVLQPFLMGHAVSVHPLAVILAIAAGVVIAGIIGALLAVPCAAVANAVVNHLAGNDPPPREAAPVAATPD